jgi:hypothetical protein
MRHEYSLDALNFFLADVRQGLGPYLAIYLLTERHWAEDQIGFVMTIATASSLVVQAPAGAAESVFGPAVAAITLGLMGSRAFARPIGRNESFNHAGNAVAAALAGVCAWKEGTNRRLLYPGWHGFTVDRERPRD